jgi:hypothetical protein
MTDNKLQQFHYSRFQNRIPDDTLVRPDRGARRFPSIPGPDRPQANTRVQREIKYSTLPTHLAQVKLSGPKSQPEGESEIFDFGQLPTLEGVIKAGDRKSVV